MGLWLRHDLFTGSLFLGSMKFLYYWFSVSRYSKLQYSSQIVETDTVSPEFSGKIPRFTPHTRFLTEVSLLPPQCWATRILDHWDDCKSQINIGEGEIALVFQDLWRVLYLVWREERVTFSVQVDFMNRRWSIPAWFVYRCERKIYICSIVCYIHEKETKRKIKIWELKAVN